MRKAAGAKFGSKDSTRFGTGDKHLSFMEKIPTLEGGKTKVRRLVCISENCPKKEKKEASRRVTKWCCECAAPLCFPECFLNFHTPK